ncbi:hypothetical protein DACRYDRAFT_99028 [Dacryopinax primogenitus]|uniref:Uncharacterized protein n=1 Tax=Dacryopinax primogenitus (strain DJM 731) TaxID=1858805 RepID=M5GD98_DACPD|nr:uncharacterized protein DACRYDRAFT_99028 [Dacryopinax primogenitus]EJU04377.1 hypothetical protein DACRYDRAFT_99028 [Dacryopinax primogenitus]
MARFLPPELKEEIVRNVISDTPPSAYMWPPSVEKALRSLSQSNRDWRRAAADKVFQRLVIRSRRQIIQLLASPHKLRFVQSMALLPGSWDYANRRTRNGNHAYCTDDLAPLFLAVAPSLQRLFIFHYHTNEPRCSRWPSAISRLLHLEELVVHQYASHFPHLLFRWEAGEEEYGGQDTSRTERRAEIGFASAVSLPQYIPVGHSNADTAAYSVPSGQGRGMHHNNPASAQGDEDDHYEFSHPDDFLCYRPSWPSLPMLKRLAISANQLKWKDFKFVEFFPRIEQLVFVDYTSIEEDAEVRSIGRQLRENPSFRVVLVEQSREDVPLDWEDDMPLLPQDRFLFHLYDASEINTADPWLVQRALLGGIFDVGTSFSELRRRLGY